MSKAKAAATPSLKPAVAKPVTGATMQLLVGEKAITEALVSINRRGATLQADIHVAACSVLKHIGEHSDVRLIGALLAAMPDMSRKNAVRDWFVKFGPVTFEQDKAVFDRTGKVKLGDAMAMPFWKLVPEKPYQPIDMAKFIPQMVKKLERDTLETKVDHTAMIAALNALAIGGVTAH
jgi:hypothetical protein